MDIEFEFGDETMLGVVIILILLALYIVFFVWKPPALMEIVHPKCSGDYSVFKAVKTDFVSGEKWNICCNNNNNHDCKDVKPYE